MKYIILILLLSISLFAGAMDDYNAHFKVSQELSSHIMVNGKCDAKTIKKYVDQGAWLTYLVRPRRQEFMKYDDNTVLTTLRNMGSKCDEAVKYLESIDAPDNAIMEAKQAKKAAEAKEAEEQRWSKLTQEQRDQELISNRCNLEKVKELIAKGANKDTVLDYAGYYNVSLYASVAHGQGGNCAKTAYYLSSIGAKDIGAAIIQGYNAIVLNYPYDKPKVFETKHLKVTIKQVSLNGGSGEVFFENKMDDYIYIYSVLSEVNGIKHFINFKQPDGTTNFHVGPYKTTSGWVFGFRNDDQNKYPKVVNNKMKFNRQFTLKYTYKGKEYELKTPILKEEFDVKYITDDQENPFCSLGC